MRSHCNASFRSLFVCLLCGMAAALFCGENVAAGEEQVHPVSVTVTVDRHEFQTFEPIRVTILVKNTSDKNIYLMLGYSENFIAELEVFVLLNSQKRNVPKSQYYILGNLRFPDKGGTPLVPGETQEFTIVANLVSDMTLPGNYEISASVPYWLTSGRPESGRKLFTSDPLKVRITPMPYVRILKRERNWNKHRS